jgi:uncharacterized membrane protein
MQSLFRASALLAFLGLIGIVASVVLGEDKTVADPVLSAALIVLCGSAALTLASFCYGAWREIAARRTDRLWREG